MNTITAQKRRALTNLLAKLDVTTAQVKSEKALLKQAQAREKAVLEAQALTQSVAEVIQNQAHRQIASVVSRCLEAVFGEEAYSFEIRFSQKRGKTEAEFLFVRYGMEIDPLSAAGGGVVDVAAFALRLACLVLARPRRRRFLALDEPFRFLSAEYRPRGRALLETLAEELGLQVFMVTHSRELVCGKVIELE